MAYSAPSSSSAASPAAASPAIAPAAKDEKPGSPVGAKPKALPPVPFLKLFRFADGWDKFLIVIGALFSGAAGVSELCRHFVSWAVRVAIVVSDD